MVDIHTNRYSIYDQVKIIGLFSNQTECLSVPNHIEYKINRIRLKIYHKAMHFLFLNTIGLLFDKKYEYVNINFFREERKVIKVLTYRHHGAFSFQLIQTDLSLPERKQYQS